MAASAEADGAAAEANKSQRAADIRAGLVNSARAGNVASLRSHLAVQSQGAIDKRILGTALHLTVAAGHLECCEVLLNSGADVDERSSSGATCMHLAAERGDADMMRKLMDFQASLNVRNADGKCAIAVSKNTATRKLISDEVQRRVEAAEHRKRVQLSLKRVDGSCKRPSPSPPHGQRSPLALRTDNSSRGEVTGRKDGPAFPAKDLLICRVCLREFCTEPKTEPVCLPCGHTFCRTCIDSLRGATGRAAVSHSFRCPLDRQVFSRNLELRVNTLLQEMIPIVNAICGPASTLRSVRDVSLSPMLPPPPSLTPTTKAKGTHNVGVSPITVPPRLTADAAVSPMSAALVQPFHSGRSMEAGQWSLQAACDGHKRPTTCTVEKIVDELVDGACLDAVERMARRAAT